MSKGYFSCFILGAIVGGAVTYRFVKKKYEQIAQEEIDSVKEVYSKKNKNESKDAGSWERESKPDLKEYAARIQREGYSDYHTKSAPVSGGEPEESGGPYVISPDEFGENEEYERISLTYYADGIVADNDDDILDNIEGTIGSDSLKHFGEYEDDAVFVRNDERRCDYEILLDYRKYSDVAKTKPNPVEIE